MMTAKDNSGPRVALVTGAGRRLGRAIALGMAHAGWDVAVHYRASEAEAREVVAEIAALGRRAVALHCELADEAAVRQLVPRAWPRWARCTAWSTTPRCSTTTARTTSAWPAGRPHARQRRAPLLLAQALHAATPDGQQAV
jgi:NAD(P)-dependent dehydrogenase (short-subunit alcohol dehydrogenase family)